MSLIRHSTLQERGWEFSLHHRDPDERLQLEKFLKLRLPMFTSELELCIKHLDSGIEFRFYSMDALAKWMEEAAKNRDPLESEFPSYVSPLRPAGGFDSTYVGRVLIKKPDEETLIRCSEWEYINLETLAEQIVWATKNEQISGVPSSLFFHRDDGPIEPKNRSTKRKLRKKSEEKGLRHPLFNYSVPLYFDNCKHGDSSCYFHLVVTRSGWFISLCQLFCKCSGARREREVTMHCNFDQNIIYREIFERESEIGHFTMEKNQGDEMLVHFHEAKRLKIQGYSPEVGGGHYTTSTVGPEPNKDFEKTTTIGNQSNEAYRGGLIYRATRDTRSSFAIGEFKKMLTDVPDEMIGSLFANCGEKLKFIEAETGTRIEIIPLFRHPYNPKISVSRLPGKAPRRVYIYDGEPYGVSKYFEPYGVSNYFEPDGVFNYFFNYFEPYGVSNYFLQSLERIDMAIQLCSTKKETQREAEIDITLRSTDDDLISLPCTGNSNEGSVKYCRQCVDIGYYFSLCTILFFCFILSRLFEV